MKNVAVINTCIGGSTGKIAVGLHNYLLNRHINSWFCYGREDGEVGEKFYKIEEKLSIYFHAAFARITGLQGYASYFATRRLINFIKQNKIDTIFLISPHGYYLNESAFFAFIAEENITLVYVMIDEYAFSGKCGYSTGCEMYHAGCHHCPKIRMYPKSFFINAAPLIFNMKKKSYKNIKKLVFVGPLYTVEQAKKSPHLFDQRIEVLDEAVNTAFYIPRNNSELRSELGISDEKIVLVCVAPYSYDRKGVKYFVELARRFEKSEKYVFVQVGFDVSRESVDLPQNYIAIGFIKDQEKLAHFYSLGDLFVFPSVSDTMPNACLEALSAGTPLLCFNISGMPYIADETVATFVEPRNVNQMEAVVKKTVKKTEDQIWMCREYALKRYDNQKYFSKLCDIAERI